MQVPDAGGNVVDGHHVPVTHFGIVLEMKDWQALADRLVAVGREFDIEFYVRFKRQLDEEATMFFRDPQRQRHRDEAFEDLGQLLTK